LAWRRTDWRQTTSSKVTLTVTLFCSEKIPEQINIQGHVKYPGMDCTHMFNTSCRATRGLKAGESGIEYKTTCLHKSRILLPPAAPFATESTHAESNYTANIDYNQF
jgi:hypothetical protein